MADLKKRCSICGPHKYLGDFNKHRSRRDGYSDSCRACASERHKREYQKDADRIKQKASKYYYDNKKTCNERGRKYYRRTQPLRPIALCKCGCGAMAEPGRSFIFGHVNKGREFSAEFCFNMSEVKKNMSPETKHKMSESAKDKVVSLDTRRKMSLRMTGNKSFNWRGGISCEEYGPNWTKALKEAVLLRDGGKCRNPGCLGKSKKINRHHIDYNKKNNMMNNLITLCTPCHAATNAHREKWQAFYEGVMRGDFEYLEVADVR